MKNEAKILTIAAMADAWDKQMVYYASTGSNSNYINGKTLPKTNFKNKRKKK